MTDQYMAPVVDGTITTLRDFALRCVRAFGAMVQYSQHDLDVDAPLEMMPDPSYGARLEERRRQLAEVRAMPVAEVEAEAEREHRELVAGYERDAARSAAVNARIDAMLRQVDEWRPSADHLLLKAFMRDRLWGSRRNPPDEPQAANAAAWREKQIRYLEEDKSDVIMGMLEELVAQEMLLDASKTEDG